MLDLLNNGFCCMAMEGCVKYPNSCLHYLPEMRSYSITAPACLLKKNEIWIGYTVTFCPYCGTKLPNDLIEERMEILKKEYGIDDPYDSKQKKRISEEFKTDEWWKKREL